MAKDYPQIDTKTPPTTKVVYLDTGVAIFSTPGNPQGIVSANPGSMAIDSQGLWYRKASGIGNIGWVDVSGGGGIPNLSGFGRALPPRTDTVFSTATNGILHIYNLPNNSLPTDGSYFRFNGAGSIVIDPANRVQVSLNISFVGSGYNYNAIQLATGQVNFAQFNSWRMWGDIIRVDASTLRAVVTEIFNQSIISAPGSGPSGASGGHLIATQDQTFTVPPNYFTGSSMGIQFMGGAVNNAQEIVVDNQISQDLTTIEIYQF